jgi:hypothetical protein
MAPVSIDYRARAAIRQLDPAEHASVYAMVDRLAREGLESLAKAGQAHRVVGLRLEDGRAPIYELRVPQATDLRIFVSATNDGKNSVVTDVLRRDALQNAAQSF